MIAASRFKTPEEFAHHLGNVVLKKIDNQLRARKEHNNLVEAKDNGSFEGVFGNDSLFMNSMKEEEDEARQY